MDEQTFREHIRSLGYSEPHVLELGSGNPSGLHAHGFSSIGLVIRGRVTLEFENSAITNDPGDFCEIAAGVLHDERPGPEGVTVLLATKAV